ncbi:carboxymuconolactone decarboxylase family protein [Paenarthrobacter sp. NPDC058040]|uniref:carboxymuconolactone decarboxylase family protein n=1 Tax=unclassified Paenarthrobacter TaxID=2634190 RepID=UPI0036DEDB85
MSSVQPRIPPRPVDEWDDDVDQALSVLSVQGHGAPSGAPKRPSSHIIGIYAWHPDLIRGWMPFSNHLRRSSLDDRVRELAIIRTAWLSGGEYEWAQHVRMSRANGWLTDAELEAISLGSEAPEWSADDAAVLQAVDQMVQSKNVTSPVWTELERQFTRQQLIDLVFTVGTYDMHAMAFATLGLQLEPGMQGFPSSHRAEGRD